MEKPENRPWEVLSSEYLAREPWFTVRRERLRLPDGRIVPSYYVFEYPAWVNVIAITRDGHFVMIDQYRHGLGETDYEITAGVVEPTDASLLAAAQRELMEETGYGGGQWRELMTLSANPATQNNLTHTFLATGVERQGDQHLDPTRRAAGRPAPRPDGRPARAPLHRRAGARAAPHGRHPPGADGRAAVALLLRKKQLIARKARQSRPAYPTLTATKTALRFAKGRFFVTAPGDHLPTVCASAKKYCAGSSPRALSSSSAGALPRVTDFRPCPAV